MVITSLFKRFGNVVVTSGTLTPLAQSLKLLQFELNVLEPDWEGVEWVRRVTEEVREEGGGAVIE